MTLKSKENHNLILNEGYGIEEKKLYITKAENCFIYSGKRKFIDTAMGGGSLLLGHSSKIVNTAIKQQCEKGTLFTQPNHLAHQLADLLKIALPNMDNFVFATTGSEATLRAIRIARSYTKKPKIGIFSGGWHGSHDLLLFDEDYKGSEKKPNKIFKSDGSPQCLSEDIILLPYNHKQAFKIIEKYKNELAMVLIEPSQGSNPRDDMKEFLEELRQVTRKNGVLLGFDEIITGFRVQLGGAQEYYNIDADIVTYGKAVGGGLPLSIVAGKRKVMQQIKEKNIFMGGTFSANPLSISSSLATLHYLIKNKQKIYPQLKLNSKLLKDSVNDICKKHNFPCQMIGINSMLRFVFTNYPIKSRFQRDKWEKDQNIQQIFYQYMLENGVFIASNRINFLSITHDDKIMKKIIKAYKKSLMKMRKEGLL